MLYQAWVLAALGAAGSVSAFNTFGSASGAAQRPFGAPSADAFSAAFRQVASQKSPPVVSTPSFDFGAQVYDDGLFTPSVESLSELSESTFTTLQHPAFPQHSVRIKKSQFCDTKASAYTGYIDVEARHLFFYFFESRNDPAKDDVILWTNGGPGCSSAAGLFMELGPCRVTEKNKTEPNPYSWNENANVFFIDQPIGVGWSYADHGEFVSSTEEAAVDIAAFMFVFFEHFSQFKGRAFHMAGESYGGRYLPVYASAVYDMNPYLVKKGYKPVNLASVMIGNGWTDFPTMAPSFYDIVCKSSDAGPVLDISTCVRMKTAVPRCQQMINECFDTFDQMACSAGTLFCQSELMEPFANTGLNVYDISKKCDPESALCYSILPHIEAYLSKNSTKKALGVDRSRFPGAFETCNYQLHDRFFSAFDFLRPTKHYVTALLERNVRVLIYVGDYDWIANWYGNARWTEALDWSGGDEYRKVKTRDWVVDGKTAGVYKRFGGLAFATIHAGGHMAPYDKPKESLEMVKRWIADQDL